MKVFSCNHAKHPDDYHICLNHWEFVGTLVDSSGSWIEKHKVRTSVWLKNVPHWWATVTSKCLYKVGVTSKGVPLGYPLLRTGERLEKYIYHARDVYLVQYVIEQWTWLFYPGGGAVVSLPCTNLASVYIRVGWPPRVCHWGTHFYERVSA